MSLLEDAIAPTAAWRDGIKRRALPPTCRSTGRLDRLLPSRWLLFVGRLPPSDLICMPSVKAMQLHDELNMVDWIVKLFGELRPSHKGYTERFGCSGGLHRRNFETRRLMRLLRSTASCIVECEHRSLGPAMAFGKQRHR